MFKPPIFRVFVHFRRGGGKHPPRATQGILYAVYNRVKFWLKLEFYSVFSEPPTKQVQSESSLVVSSTWGKFSLQNGVLNALRRCLGNAPENFTYALIYSL